MCVICIKSMNVSTKIEVLMCVSSRFEKMAESCKKSLEILKLAQSRGLPPPRHHFEERSFNTVRWARSLNIQDTDVFTVCSGSSDNNIIIILGFLSRTRTILLSDTKL